MASYPIIRRADQSDFDRANESAKRFAARHNIPLVDHHAAPQPYEQVDSYTWGGPCPTEQQRRLSRAWLKCFRRAIGEPTAYGFGWGNVLGKPQL